MVQAQERQVYGSVGIADKETKQGYSVVNQIKSVIVDTTYVMTEQDKCMAGRYTTAIVLYFLTARLVLPLDAALQLATL